MKDRTGGSSLVRLVHNVIECHKLGTELRQNREELQASKARFYGMIQKCSDPIFIVDEQKVVHFANQAATNLFDREVKSFVGKPFEFPLVMDEPAQVEISCAGGRKVSVRLRVDETEWGSKRAHLVWVKDLSERKRAEETTRKLRAEHLALEQLRELNHKKDDFLSAVTHELRNPMTPLKSVLEMFLDGSLGNITAQQHRYIEMMARNIARLTVFTTEILTLSKLESGKYRLHPQHMSVLSAVRPVVDLFKEQASQKNIAISVDIHTEVFAFADPSAVGQVVSNLINNAIRYCPANTRIVISSRIKDSELVEVTVADNGLGIPEEDLSKIFGRFYQVSSKNGAGHEGSGVGLALCKSLVEAMGGEISAESEVGEGTIFRFTLPVTPEDSIDEESIP